MKSTLHSINSDITPLQVAPQHFEEVLTESLRCGAEFGIAFFPGEHTPAYFGSCANLKQLTMEIAPWLSNFNSRLTIGSNAPRTIHSKPIPLTGTKFTDYIKNVNAVIESCKKRNGKTVYSRVLCGELPDCLNNTHIITDIASKLFAQHPNTLRFIYHTPETDTWLGATPELLLDFNKITGEFHTMAFAGTRKRNSAEPWDLKNIDENKFVIDYILQQITSIGAEAQAESLQTIPYGEVEHICVPITGRSTPEQLPAIIDAINPTPALCGWPKEDAIKDIELYEHHSRGCYGGFIGFNEPTRYRAFVNLRCMQTDGKNYCIYGGGGITAQSVAEAEFDETSGKTALLRQLVHLDS